ncbi:MAG: hypothetical protein QW478_01695 [Candidatus Micrarchaeaceae archaeon]
MSYQLQFDGLVKTYNFLQNGHLDPGTTTFDINCVDLLNTYVQWNDPNTPEVLRNSTYQQLITNPDLYNVFHIHIHYSGEFDRIPGSSGNNSDEIYLVLCNPLNGKYPYINGDCCPPGTNQCGDNCPGDYCIEVDHFSLDYSPGSNNSVFNEDFVVDTYPVINKLCIHNRCAHNCDSRRSSGDPIKNVTLIYEVRITTTLKCVNGYLETVPQCTNYCLNTSNLNNCYQDMVNWCLPYRIGYSNTCYKFFASYISSTKTIPAAVEDGLNEYCTKFKGLGDLLSSQSTNDINLCACHMRQQQYNNFAATVLSYYPGYTSYIQTPGFVTQCLLNQCANSPFKSFATTATCNLPQCLEIVTFNNDGTFNNSNVTINTSSDCTKIVGKYSTPKLTSSSNNVKENNSGITIGIIILAIILFFIIIFIIYIFVRKNKPKLK